MMRRSFTKSGAMDVASSITVSSPATAVSCGRWPSVTPRSRLILPSSGDSVPRMMEKSVVFPAPFGPTSPMRSARFTCSAASANKTCPPYALLMPERVNMKGQNLRGNAGVSRIRCVDLGCRQIRLARPAKLGGRGTRVVVAFPGCRTNDVPCYVRVMSIAEARLKRLFHAPILAGMKRENRNAAARIPTRGHMAQQHVERGEFVVHRDAQRLKHPAHGEVGVVFFRARHRGADGGGE